MQVAIKILSEPKYQELYYLYIWNKIENGFYQKNGFVVLPEATIKTPAEVVFPFSEEVFDDKVTNFLKGQNINFPLNHFDEKIQAPELNLFEAKTNIQNLETFIVKNKKAIDTCLHFLLPKASEAIELNIIPVNFGTSGSFFFKKHPKKLKFLITFRTDLQEIYFVKTLISSLVVYNLSDNKSDEADSVYWQKRQFLTDYLFSHTYISKMFTIDEAYKTLVSIKQLEQLAEVVKTSNAYLTKLKAVFAPHIKFEGDILIIDDKPVYLTDSEKAIFNYLLMHTGHVCTFDELGDMLWQDEEKFSLATLSKFISNIRKKLKDAGVLRDVIYTARGKGVLLAIS